MLSDVGNRVARSFGLVFALPEKLRAALRSANKALPPPVDRDESCELPVLATYVIALDGRVALAFVDLNYGRRLSPEDILKALRSV